MRSFAARHCNPAPPFPREPWRHLELVVELSPRHAAVLDVLRKHAPVLVSAPNEHHAPLPKPPRRRLAVLVPRPEEVTDGAPAHLRRHKRRRKRRRREEEEEEKRRRRRKRRRRWAAEGAGKKRGATEALRYARLKRDDVQIGVVTVATRARRPRVGLSWLRARQGPSFPRALAQ